MQIGFVERLAEQTMARTGVSRAAAKRRHAIVWAVLAAICGAVWLAVPLKAYSLTRRGTEVPLDFLIPAVGFCFALMALACLVSRPRNRD